MDDKREKIKQDLEALRTQRDELQQEAEIAELQTKLAYQHYDECMRYSIDIMKRQQALDVRIKKLLAADTRLYKQQQRQQAQ